MESKTRQAIRWLNESAERTQYAAARVFGVSQSAISVAMQKQTRDVKLWREYGPRIEQKEATGNSEYVNGIPGEVYARALRGRSAAQQLAGRTAYRPEYAATKVDDALDWLEVNGGSVKDAAARAGVSIQGIYTGRKVRAARAKAFEALGSQMCEKISKHVDEHPAKSLLDVARHFDIPLATMRDAMTARATAIRCATAPRPLSDWQLGWAACQAQCAMVAEAIGGVDGVHVAAVIRGL